jgi:HD superfamily phosphohydrolase
MYWQVYLHKTVLSAEQMLVKIIERAKAVKAIAAGPLAVFLETNAADMEPDIILQHFVQLDDVDVMMAIKQWRQHPDPVLNLLCGWLLDRKLLKVTLQTDPIDQAVLDGHLQKVKAFTGWKEEDCRYLVFTGEAQNTMYKTGDEQIEILFKDGTVRDISQVDNALIRQNQSRTVGKFYICWPQIPS